MENVRMSVNVRQCQISVAHRKGSDLPPAANRVIGAPLLEYSQLDRDPFLKRHPAFKSPASVKVKVRVDPRLMEKPCDAMQKRAYELYELQGLKENWATLLAGMSQNQEAKF